MTLVPLTPFSGINTEEEDKALLKQVQNAPSRHMVRDAVNFDVTPSGTLVTRSGMTPLSPLAVLHPWTSPLHGDVFAATPDGEWAMIADDLQTARSLGAMVGTDFLYHAVVGQDVVSASTNGLFLFDGSAARRFTVDTPPTPQAAALPGGSLPAGAYQVCISWLRGTLESGLSSPAYATVAAQGAVDVTLPLVYDQSVTGVRVYLTHPDSGDLRRVASLTPSTPSLGITTLGGMGGTPQFQRLDPMPTGRYLQNWYGRLLTVSGRTLNFSQAMAMHLHDPLTDFVQLPQRITFLAPVSGGLWVGQLDHVVFLRGTAPDKLTVEKTPTRAPVPGSASSIPAEYAPEDLDSGAGVAVWLADNGFVIGGSNGTVRETGSRMLAGLRAPAGQTVIHRGRITSLVKFGL